MRYIWRFHNWYDDTCQEPWRFLLMLGLVLPAITGTIWVTNLTTFSIWVGYVALMLGPRVYRHHRGRPQ